MGLIYINSVPHSATQATRAMKTVVWRKFKRKTSSQFPSLGVSEVLSFLISKACPVSKPFLSF